MYSTNKFFNQTLKSKMLIKEVLKIINLNIREREKQKILK